MSEMTVVTYGGLSILENILNGIAMLFHNKGPFYYYSYMAALFGAFITIAKSFFSPDLNLFKNNLLSILIFWIILLNTTTTVYIEDRLVLERKQTVSSSTSSDTLPTISEGFHKAGAKVENIPFLIGFLSKMISTIGYKITKAVEAVMHIPNDLRYSEVGMLFGSESAIEMANIQISDGILDANLKAFCRNCVTYDLGLHFYTLDDLKHTNNLLEFLKNKTANSRYVYYQEGHKGELVSCKNAIEKIGEKLAPGGKELLHQAKKAIFQHLPLTYYALTKISEDKDKLIQQSLIISALMNENATETFAVKRAALQQKSTYQVIGAQAGNSLVWMRNVLEALVYASIIFIIPLCFLPSGFTYLLNWIYLVIWIQLWPPFYAILQYIMQIKAYSEATNYILFQKSSMTIYSAPGLSEIYSNISALSGYLSLFIPFLSYAILKGGVGSLVHLAGSIISPVLSAGSVAGSEASSGNYSFNNKTMDTIAYANATGFQQNLSPSLAHGFITEKNISGEVDYGVNQTINREKLSSHAFSLSSDHSLSSSLQSQLQTAKTAHESASNSFQESLSNLGRQTSDFTHHLANDTSHSLSESSREAYDASNSARWLESNVEAFSNNHGLSKAETWELFGSLSGAIKGVGIGGNYKSSGVSDETWQHAKNMSESQEFQNNFQKVMDYANNASINQTDGEGIRLAQSFTESLDHAKSSSSQFSSSLDKFNQTLEATQWMEQSSLGERRALDQEFFNFLQDNLGSAYEAQELLKERNSKVLQNYATDFFSTFLPNHMTSKIPDSFQKPEEYFNNSTKKIEKMGNNFESSFTESMYYSSKRDPIIDKVDNNIERGKKIIDESTQSSDSLKFKEEVRSAIYDPYKSPEWLEKSFNTSISLFEDWESYNI